VPAWCLMAVMSLARVRRSGGVIPGGALCADPSVAVGVGGPWKLPFSLLDVLSLSAASVEEEDSETVGSMAGNGSCIDMVQSRGRMR
jgi:hypothetical protein